MSELIDNREHRQEQLKEIIKDLHRGKSVDEVKGRFRDLIKDVGATEISVLEQKLINEGFPEEEIKRLCDVHVALFKESLDEQAKPETTPGHPVHTFEKENEAILKVVEETRATLKRLKEASGGERPALIEDWRRKVDSLMEVEKHYSRKENLLFPYLEKYGITGPPSVMWSVHDDIRAGLKSMAGLLYQAGTLEPAELSPAIDEKALPVLDKIVDMVYKENKILLPMSLETLTQDEWKEIARESPGIGFCLVEPGDEWPGVLAKEREENLERIPPDELRLDTGYLTPKEINLLLKHLPVDITYVDKDHLVRYFSKGQERIFTRTEAVIGRKVEMCHPPESVHVVKKIIEDFEKGKRDVAEFWIEFNGAFVHIRYFAVRDDDGSFQGVLEVTQDVTRIRQLEGEKRLLDD